MSENIRIYRGGCSVENLATSDDRIPNLIEIDIAHTLLSRDYKGLSNYGSNACIEVIHLGKKEDIWKQEE